MRRLLLKLSGEALGGEAGFGVEPAVLSRLAAEIGNLLTVRTQQLAVVLGGGNLLRGAQLAASGMDRVTADRMGMLATVMNGLALSGALRQAEIANKVYSATAIAGVAQGYERDAALAAMNDGEVVILTGGTGNPYFTTDTAACLRGLELGVDAVLKATNVDGVYDADPKYNARAVKFDEITYDEVLERQLGVMDLTAIVLCRDHAMPLVVFDVQRPGALVDIAAGARVGSRVVAASSG